jgi:hypothetical protein
MRSQLRLAFVCTAVLLLANAAVPALADDGETVASDPGFRGIGDRILGSDAYIAGPDFELADFQQPSPSVRPPTAARRPTRRPVAGQELAPPTAEDVGDYLASAPRMFGHYFGAVGQLRQRSFGENGVIGEMVTDIPMGGGAGPLQITDNATPLPQSRSFFNYNHFENALRTRAGGREIASGVDQYTIGTEQPFLDGICSWQLQLPITGGFSVPGDPGVSTGQIGNLGFITKTAIWRSDYSILSGGFGLDLPTGSSVRGEGPSGGYEIRNSSTGVLPFLGIMVLPTDATFFQTFISASVPASGNQVFVTPFAGAPARNVGVFTPQTRLHLDLAAGTWFYQNPGGGGVTGMAFVGEVHYVAATQSGDVVNFSSFNQTATSNYQLGNLSNQQTVTNFTLGIHTTWNDRFQFRIGGAFPLAERPNRGFDGEVIAQINFIP